MLKTCAFPMGSIKTRHLDAACARWKGLADILQGEFQRILPCLWLQYQVELEPMRMHIKHSRCIQYR